MVCLEKSNCVTFSWTYAEGGTCYLKDGGVARYTSDTPVCGKVLSRKTVIEKLYNVILIHRKDLKVANGSLKFPYVKCQCL